MLDYTLKNVDPEEIEYLLVKVEKSFDIKFVDNELIHIATFGELCDILSIKLSLITPMIAPLNKHSINSVRPFHRHYKLTIN